MTTTVQPAAMRRRNQRVDRYRDLVRPLACHYAQRCQEPLEDLIQVGMLGLLRAAELFRERGGTPFEAFARPHVRGAILHYLRDAAPLLRLPRRVVERQRQLQLLRQSWQGPAVPSTEDLRCRMGLSQEQWQQLELAEQTRRVVPISEEQWEQLEAPRAEHGGDRPTGRTLIQALMGLEPGLQTVLRRVVLEGQSYRQVGAALQISPMTVQRRLQRGLARLRLSLDHPAAWSRHAPSGAAAC